MKTFFKRLGVAIALGLLSALGVLIFKNKRKSEKIEELELTVEVKEIEHEVSTAPLSKLVDDHNARFKKPRAIGHGNNSKG